MAEGALFSVVFVHQWLWWSLQYCCVDRMKQTSVGGRGAGRTSWSSVGCCNDDNAKTDRRGVDGGFA
jgi:hypothetical protein